MFQRSGAELGDEILEKLICFLARVLIVTSHGNFSRGRIDGDLVEWVLSGERRGEGGECVKIITCLHIDTIL